MHWHQREINEVIQELKSFPHGLSTEEARRRPAEHDPNELSEKKKKTPFLPALNPVFRTEPLSPGELALALAASSLIFIAVELEKAWRRSRSGHEPT